MSFDVELRSSRCAGSGICGICGTCETTVIPGSWNTVTPY
jgi:hypothetical protein